MPLMRVCTLTCSLRTWKLPLAAESWVTPGNRSTIFSIVALVPCGSASIALWLIVLGAVPGRRVDGAETLVERGRPGLKRVCRRRPHRPGSRRGGANAGGRRWFGLRLCGAHQDFGKLHLRGGDPDAAERRKRRRAAKQPQVKDATGGRAIDTNRHDARLSIGCTE
jgi:hypothetical protein